MMVIFRSGILAFALLPLVTVPVVMAYAPHLIIGSGKVDIPTFWSLVGLVLSYYGLIFSLYAAIEVFNLSNRYFFKIRSPDILKKINSISKKVNLFSSEPSQDLHSQNFIFETLVITRAAKRIKNAEVKRVAKEVDMALSHLRKQANVALAMGTTAGEVQGYWDFFQKISELADEVKTQMEDVRAA